MFFIYIIEVFLNQNIITLYMNLLPEFEKKNNEIFNSMLLSFATSATKKGLHITKYEMIVQKPTRLDPFYQITFNAYQNNKIK